jgi:transcription elongation factor Elf1
LEKRTNEEYLEASHQCPYCGSDDITSLGHPDVECTYVYQDIVCQQCGNQWTDEYKLIGYTESEL